MRDGVAPLLKLGVEIVEIAKRPRREERIAEVLDLAFDAAFLVGPGRRAGPGREVIVAGELE